MLATKINYPQKKARNLKWLVFCLGTAVLFWAGCEPGVDKKELEAWTKQKVTADWGMRENGSYNLFLKVDAVSLIKQNPHTYVGTVVFREYGLDPKTKEFTIPLDKTEDADLLVVVDKDKRLCKWARPEKFIAEWDEREAGFDRINERKAREAAVDQAWGIKN